MANNYYRKGDYNALCDSCGFKFKSSELMKRWDGLMVDKACWETRQPQDLVRAVIETSTHLPWTRPYDPGDDAVVPFAPDGYVDDGYWINSYDQGN